MKNQDGESKASLPPPSPCKIRDVLGPEDSDLAEAPGGIAGSGDCHHQLGLSGLKHFADDRLEMPVNEEQREKEEGVFP